MHGVIAHELHSWVRAEYGKRALLEIVACASARPLGFVNVLTYPDEQFFDFIDGAVRVTQQSKRDLLFAFGKYCAAALLERYSARLPSSWNALDVIEHAEDTMHVTAREEDAGALPPVIRCVRRDGELTLRYASERKMCDFGRGLIVGIGAALGPLLAVRETHCAHDGADHCEMLISPAA